MMIAVYIALCLVVGYMFGCISTAYIVGKMNNIDIREHGSQNAGTTNAMRTLGKKAGIIVFLGDCIKAVVPMIIMYFVITGLNIDLDIETMKLAVGFGAVLGHNFPFWLNFRGGKGIAVTSAVILAFCLPVYWLCPAIALALFIAIVLITKYVSLGSLIVVTTFLAYNAIMFRGQDNYLRIVIITFLFAASGFFMHRANIVRLLNGTENKIGSKKKNMQGNMQSNMMNQNMNNMQNNMMNQNMNNMQNNMMNQNMNNMQNNNMQQNVNNMQNNTMPLYNEDYLKQIKPNQKKFDNNSKEEEFYQAYDSCETIDETRALSESELENYYKN